MVTSSVRLSATTFACVLTLSGCAGTSQTEVPPIPSPLIGKTKDSIITCAGVPYSELKAGNATILRYYKEAPMLEESKVASKGSVPGIHRGCWASLLIEESRVTGIEFRSAPDSEKSIYLCENLFQTCLEGQGLPQSQP